MANPLAKQYGERSGAALVAARARIPRAAAAVLGKVGMGLRARTSLTGDELPTLRPLVATALDEGRIPLESARLALECLDRAERHLSVAKLALLESDLVDKAESWAILEFQTYAQHAADLIDAEGVAPREALQREQETVKVIERRNGMTRAILDMAPESAGFFRTALNMSTPPRPSLATDDGQFNDLAMTDTRSLGQRRLDGIIGLLRTAIRVDNSQVAGVDTTMLLAVRLEDLESRDGAAIIYGVNDPISIATALRLAATAKILPIVLDSDGEVLHLGRGQRLFNRAQRRAMVFRDGGCVFEGCNEPLSRLQAAHILAWIKGGRTDIDNGLLLCAFHHRLFDLGGWELLRQGGQRYLVPPPDIDPLRRPRPIRDRRPSFEALLQ